jgi:hypothetical protein
VDAILHTQKRKYTKLRDDRIAELLPLGLSEREIWGKLADEGLFESAPTVGSGQRVPPKLRKAIHVVREAEQARHREMIRGFENLAEKD